MRRCAAPPSVVSSSNPEVMTSSRPTYVRPGTLGRRSKTVRRPAGSPRLTTTPIGLLRASHVAAPTAGRTARPSTTSRWRSGSTLSPTAATTPSTWTRPARIRSSALRRDVGIPAHVYGQPHRPRLARLQVLALALDGDGVPRGEPRLDPPLGAPP